MSSILVKIKIDKKIFNLETQNTILKQRIKSIGTPEGTAAKLFIQELNATIKCNEGFTTFLKDLQVEPCACKEEVGAS